MKKISFNKIFCALSVLFIASCCIYYGTRFLRLYLANKKVEIAEKNSLVKVIRDHEENNELFKTINGNNYFTGNSQNNYLSYMNMLWRIIKVNDDNSLTIITDKSIASLAYGKVDNYESSHIYNWLNKSSTELTGILEKNLDKDSLVTLSYCDNQMDEPTNTPCEKTVDNKYISLLTIMDYLNIGSKDSFLVNGEYFYLTNSTTENKAWYIDPEGALKYSTGTDILGIRPVVNIKPNIDFVSGDGTSTNPYVVETTKLFGSYVKLGNDIWRVYDDTEDTLRLMLNNYIKNGDNNLTYRYSNNTSYHNDTINGSIAYYLNHDFLNSLPYKDHIKEIKWSNGYYNVNTNCDYRNALKDTVDTRVSLISIGNIIVNPELNNYYTATGNNTKSQMVYYITKDKKLFTKQVTNSLPVVPAISLDKNLLKKGNGTKDSPYEME